MRLDNSVLEKIARILCANDKEDGKTGVISKTQLDNCFKDYKYKDNNPINTSKHKILLDCFLYFKDNDSSKIQFIINYLMNPAIYGKQYKKQFEDKINQLNHVLIFSGLEINDSGTIREIKEKATTIDEIDKTLQKLKDVAKLMNWHRDCVKYCIREYLEKNYFHCIFEASKSILDRVRKEANITEDGDTLLNIAFGNYDDIAKGKHNRGAPTVSTDKDYRPYLVFNRLDTKDYINDHFGFVNLMKGMTMLFRNIPAHHPKQTYHEVSELELMEAMGIISYIHRKLDKVQKIR